jgi:hypothetical protein
VRKARRIEFIEWLEDAPYTTERKNQLIEAFDKLNGGRPTKKQCSHIDSFAKSEFYDTWKHARIINSRHDAFKVWSGPRFKAIEEVVYELSEFIKHIPVPERPSYVASLKAAGRRYYSTDFKAYESHFTPALMEVCECELYRHCLSWDSDVEFLCSVIKGTNRMRTRTGVHVETRGRRMSGDMCTSLGNGFTNLMLAKFIAHRKGGNLEGYVEGDDGIFCTDFELTKQDYEELGFTIEIKELDDPCKASFCGMVFADSGEIIRDPRKFLMGFGWTQSFINAGPKIMDELLRAKALSCVYETPQCPIIGAFAREALKATSHVHPRFVMDGYKTALPDVKDVPEFNPKPDTRELFAQRFGVSINTQLAIETCVRHGDMDGVAALLPPTVEQFTYSMNYVTVT